MSKINFSFNDIKYSVDESALAPSKDRFRSHLQTVLSGEGDVINFDGVSYNIDSDKLTAAKNEFTTRLASLAGEGTKIVVGGVEYSVDSSKLQTVVSNMQTAFSELENNGANETSVMYRHDITVIARPVNEDVGQIEANFSLISADSTNCGGTTPMAVLFEMIRNYDGEVGQVIYVDSDGNDQEDSIQQVDFDDEFQELVIDGCDYTYWCPNPTSITDIVREVKLCRHDLSFINDRLPDDAYAEIPPIASANLVVYSYINTACTDSYAVYNLMLHPESCEGQVCLHDGTTDEISSVSADREFREFTLYTISGTSYWVNASETIDISDTVTWVTETPEEEESLAPGLYSNGVMTKTWDNLIADGTLTVTDGGVLKCVAPANNGDPLEGDLVIPNDGSIITLGDQAFMGRRLLTSIVIPDSVISIGTQAFFYCTSLASVVLSNNLESISYSVFKNCMALTSIIIPESVTMLDNHAFSSCEALTNITFAGTTAQWDAIDKDSTWCYQIATSTIQCTDGQVEI